MEIQHLRSFLQVLKTGSFSKAARLTFRTQPTVSLQIQQLEKELGTRLFERFGPMSVKPTANALALQTLATPLLESFDSIKTRFEATRVSADAGEIRIASHESVIAYLLPDLVAPFIHKYPKLKFTFFRKNKADIVAMVASGEADFGITTLERVPRGIEYERFRVHRRVVIAPKNSALRKEARLTLKSIARWPLILPPPQSETRTLVDQCFQKAGLKYSLSLELTGRDAVKKYVEKGFGVSVMSDYYLIPGDEKHLEILDASHLFGTTSRGLLTRKGRVLSPIQKDLVESFLSTS